MANIQRNFRSWPRTKKIQFAMRAEVVFLNSNHLGEARAKAAMIKKRRQALQLAMARVADAEQVAAQMTSFESEAERHLDAVLMASGIPFEEIFDGDPEQVNGHGPVSAGNKEAPGVPEAVELIVGQVEGELICSWKGVAGACDYEAQICEDPVSASGWRSNRVTSKLQTTFVALSDGKRYRARVRAHHSAGTGEWSRESESTMAL